MKKKFFKSIFANSDLKWFLELRMAMIFTAFGEIFSFVLNERVLRAVASLGDLKETGCRIIYIRPSHILRKKLGLFPVDKAWAFSSG